MKTLNICFYVTGTSSSLSSNFQASCADDFEKKYDSSLKYIVSFLNEIQSACLSVSLDGTLLSWIDKKHPEFTQHISKLIGRKQAEILGGGYYNPIFPLLFPQDRTGQIELMTSEIRRTVGKKPRGMTVFNSIWDTSLIPCFESSGMEFVLLDSSLIPKEKKCYLPLLASEQGRAVSVLPVSREFIPNPLVAPREYLRNLFDTVNYLTKDDPYNSLTEGRVVVIKIGESQFARLCESKWLSKLFGAASEFFPDSIKITLPTEYLHREETRIPSYIPAGIQSDVAKWSMKPYEETVLSASSRPTIFDFLLTYPQNKDLYNRMLYISLMLNQCKGDKARKNSAREKLWMAQGGEAYVCDPDGVFANNAIRQQAYRNLTEAEKLVREAMNGKFLETVSCYDSNGDGFKEFICAMNQYNACISLKGAQISELDIIHNTGNYADSLSRIRQFDKVEDKYHRGLFVDHLFSADEFSDYKKGLPTGSGIFSETIFRQVDFSAHRHEIKLSAGVTVPPLDAKITLLKKYIANSNGFTVQYIFKNESPVDFKGVFVVESNYAQTDFSSVRGNSYKVEVISNEEKTEIYGNDSTRTVKKVSLVQITDTTNDISFIYEPNEDCDMVCMPIIFRRPTSKSDSLTVAGNSYVASLSWSVELAAGKEIEKTINYSILISKKKSRKKP